MAGLLSLGGVASGAWSAEPAPVATSDRSAEPGALPAATPTPTPADGSRTVRVGDLDPALPWRISSLEIDGVGFFREWLLRSDFATRTRPFWAVWRPHDTFEPGFFAQDLEKLSNQLEADGYYDAKVDSDIVVLREPGPAPPGPTPSTLEDSIVDTPKGEPGLVEVKIRVEMGEPTLVCALLVDFGDGEMSEATQKQVLAKLPIQIGKPFEQSAYQTAGARLAGHFEENGHPAVTVRRDARVDAPSRCADVAYRVTPGPLAVFGETEVEYGDLALRHEAGFRDELVTREIAYEPGETYDVRRVRETERRLRGLKVFSVVRLEPGPVAPDGRVPMRLRVTPGPSREVRFGVGYSTEEELRGLASWWNYDVFGGGEQLGATARVSQINRFVSASWVQPHFPTLNSRSALQFNVGQDDESTYLNSYTRGVPQIEWRGGRDFAGSVFARGEYDTLEGVSDATRMDLKVYQSSGFTSSLGASVRWTRVDDTLDPRDGLALGFSAEVAGGPLGGDFSWLRLIANARGYYTPFGDFTLATRLTLGSIPPYDTTEEIPLWERFYAGGSGIYPVRGYGRRRIGPITGSNDPLGGRTLAIGSLEGRYPIYGPVLGVLFVDAGDIQKVAWSIDPDDIQTGVGFGLRANSPVGPIEIDLGFGLDRPKGDSLVQVSFSIGPEF